MSLLHPKSFPWGSLADPGCGTPVPSQLLGEMWQLALPCPRSLALRAGTGGASVWHHPSGYQHGLIIPQFLEDRLLGAAGPSVLVQLAETSQAPQPWADPAWEQWDAAQNLLALQVEPPQPQGGWVSCSACWVRFSPP